MQATGTHVKYYAMEAAGLAGFVIGAGLLTILLEHPDLPVMQSRWKEYPTLRRVPLGVIMGIYVMLITILWGKKSGAHINPVATWTFYRLGKISFRDAIVYTAAQFTGAIVAAQLLKYTVGRWFAHPVINYGVTAPKPQYNSMDAFIAEFIISFLLMFLSLTAMSSKKWEKKLPLLTGLLIALFIIFEMPFSGMSLNPARSTAGDLAAMKFEHLWLYFVSPVLAMLAAAEISLRLQPHRQTTDRKNLPFFPETHPLA